MSDRFFLENFLNINQVNFLRKKLEKCDLKDFEEQYRIIPNKFNFIFEEILNEKLLKIIHKNLKVENFYFLNRVKIQKNKRNFKNLEWHQDSGKIEHAKLLSKKENILFKFGLYLQENHKRYGGGVDILKPLFLDNLNNNSKIFGFIRRVYYFIRRKFFNNTIYNKEGNLIGFDALIFHRTSVVKTNDLDKLKDRFSIYFLIVNENLIQDALAEYNSKSEKKINNYKNNILNINLNNYNFNVCDNELSEVLEKVLSD